MDARCEREWGCNVEKYLNNASWQMMWLKILDTFVYYWCNHSWGPYETRLILVWIQESITLPPSCSSSRCYYYWLVVVVQFKTALNSLLVYCINIVVNQQTRFLRGVNAVTKKHRIKNDGTKIKKPRKIKH